MTNLIKCYFDYRKVLEQFGPDEATADLDSGALMHAFLAASFVDHAPRPFAYGNYLLRRRRERQPSDARFTNYFLGYSPFRLADLRDSMPHDLRPLINWHTSRECEMPYHRSGQHVEFMTRLMPTERYRSNETGKSVEKDAYLVAREELGSEAPSREVVYRRWLAEKLQSAAVLTRASIPAVAFTRVMRKGRLQPTGARAITRPQFPDIVVQGTLQVKDPEWFDTMLARGVGRQKAFGYGMLLLRA